MEQKKIEFLEHKTNVERAADTLYLEAKELTADAALMKGRL